MLGFLFRKMPLMFKWFHLLRFLPLGDLLRLKRQIRWLLRRFRPWLG